MRSLHRTLALAVAATMLLGSVPVGNACGPEYMTPIFVFKSSPDIPFTEFIGGKIGIVRPSFGRKTLTLAYRFLNGGSFSRDVQDDLIAALKGKEPEDEGDSAVEAWIEARKEIVGAEKPLPEIYTEREHSGYNFFPNCTKNAFEVALETLKDRAAKYGAQDQHVLAWLAAQDTVFQNCAEGSHVPAELGAESPAWLRKDRDYQIAAGYFYSLDFDRARARFEKIADDNESPWQEIAPYLVARTLVRQASLEETESKKHELYEQAESRLQTLSAGGGGKFTKASVKLLGLVKYNLHPEERAVELGRLLASGNDENVRQDLIDYVWLLDKFEVQVVKAEQERQKKLNPPSEENAQPARDPEIEKVYEQVQRGEVIAINYFPKTPDGKMEFNRRVHVVVPYDTAEAEILRAVEVQFQRPLLPEETKDIKDLHKSALEQRARLISPNSRWRRQDWSRYEGDYYRTDELTLELVPAFLRADDLSDWIFTLQVRDPHAYRHAFAKWRQSDSRAWLVTSLVKAETSSPGLQEIMNAAEKVAPTDSAYATVVYHLVRLKTDMGQLTEARKLLDDVMSQTALLPVSAQNQFLEQRTRFAGGLSEFLKSAQRKPVAFYKYGMIASLHELYEREKEFWNPEYMSRTEEEFERDLANEYKDLLPWDDRFSFDEGTIDILNWHFSVQLLIEAARSPSVPGYLKRNLLRAAWTRAILLNEHKVALEIVPDLLEFAPEMSPVLKPYVKSTTANERQRAALFALLKTPDLSPYLSFAVSLDATYEPTEYYMAQAWWCPLPQTDYVNDQTVPKVVPKLPFLTAAQMEAASREKRALLDLGDAKSYLGKQVLEWARSSPNDPRLPEALFIAVKANDQYKYGCDGWAHDEETKNSAEKILR
ncbi:MAG TPA: hypothetical protein VFM63_15625, partial [Pyrinomonadaceae bacterium]|nr:hypothetical protein [Pyrinomonadaceae bacterium]